MGWTIDPANHEGKAFIGIIILLLILDFCLLVSRLVIRAKHSDLSDYVLIFGFLATIGLVVAMYDTYAHGYGMTTSHFTLGDLNESWKLFAPTEILWNAGTTSIRISMMLFYQQLFHPVRTFCKLTMVLIGINIANFITVFIIALSICQPMSYVFLRVGKGHCGNAMAYETYTAASAILFDGLVVVLPMPLLWRLQIKTSKKWGLSLVLGLGVVVCTLTVVRLIASYVYMADDLPKQNALVDFITGLEPTLGILIACLPFLPQVSSRLRRRYNSTFGSQATGSKDTSHNTGVSSAARPFNRLQDTELLQTGGRSGNHRAEAVRSDSFSEDLESANMSDLKGSTSPTRTRSILVSSKFVVREDESSR
ncbi:hypothetical protein ASPACDRAFT_41160 [Aspergillus aculeatus ATCC 16872]|uniref:Rhodopsin domain-containing protein n=1 Tax=Aspergillus aculeatus (strain ATCC 16872 / CBS 172.66 / WB 5094) TaxID=690307 RepID=A0A1L9X1D8_ASPA1|nr:uncharacterized protein ASPACDRAFT_41160 [Aspergillus aculeatus ATCC 16872]OJK02335.1 hypothetical protein ASPACDRAFT_41160 [Aspergillus aculeatus ATCC 16872]